MKKRFDGCYEEWRKNRFDRIVKHYGEEFFKDKSLLEVGAGCCDLGNMFYELGAVVTCQEGRKEHTDLAKKLYPHLKIYTCDLNVGLGIDEHFDVILHTGVLYGVLYHLNDYERPLIEACSHCDHLILETEVCDSPYPYACIYINENRGEFDQSLTGQGCRPSPAAVERVLREQGFNYERVFDVKKAGPHSYNWVSKGDGSWIGGQRAFWFTEKKK